MTEPTVQPALTAQPVLTVQPVPTCESNTENDDSLTANAPKTAPNSYVMSDVWEIDDRDKGVDPNGLETNADLSNLDSDWDSLLDIHVKTADEKIREKAAKEEANRLAKQRATEELKHKEIEAKRAKELEERKKKKEKNDRRFQSKNAGGGTHNYDEYDEDEYYNNYDNYDDYDYGDY